ncbi:hypothetical protein OUZ56_014673 [Daphnia magna]|uniref:Uncharacterized protein n=1 Tax=Daphnia magna TaxID=35525 RepID=A0ABR0AKP0_9CRUS|nr:hypothetical protein OUZ56_014673 [Daphnia magna]
MGSNNVGHRIDNKSGALKMVQPKQRKHQQPKLKPVLTDEQRGLLLVVPKGVKTSTCPNAGPPPPPPLPQARQAVHQAARSSRLQLLSSSTEIIITCEYDCRCRTVGRP